MALVLALALLANYTNPVGPRYPRESALLYGQPVQGVQTSGVAGLIRGLVGTQPAPMRWSLKSGRAEQPTCNGNLRLSSMCQHLQAFQSVSGSPQGTALGPGRPGRRAWSRLFAFCLPMPSWSLNMTPDRRGCLAIAVSSCRLLPWFAESDALTMVADGAGASSGCLSLLAKFTVV